MAAPTCTRDEPKRRANIAKHGYDFTDVAEIFDGRFILTREDRRGDYGEQRYNALADLRGRINVTFTARDTIHIISARPASREERSVFHAQIKRSQER